MSIRSAIAAVAAMLLLATCSPVPPQYFRPQRPWVPPDLDPAAINSVGFAVRPALPGKPSYLETIKYIDSGVRYIDPYAEFFVSADGQLCFRGLVNRQLALFENYQNYWCMYPSQVSDVDAIENNISYVNVVRLWCRHGTPQCARRYGYQNFLDETIPFGNSISVQIVPFRQARDAIDYLVYLMGGEVRGGAPLRLSPPYVTRAAG
ncbi:MAG: hypothetical protein WA633_18490 [Stellaceae bacterium]